MARVISGSRGGSPARGPVTNPGAALAKLTPAPNGTGKVISGNAPGTAPIVSTPGNSPK